MLISRDWKTHLGQLPKIKPKELRKLPIIHPFQGYLKQIQLSFSEFRLRLSPTFLAGLINDGRYLNFKPRHKLKPFLQGALQVIAAIYINENHSF